jgi:hypothetical protein
LKGKLHIGCARAPLGEMDFNYIKQTCKIESLCGARSRYYIGESNGAARYGALMIACPRRFIYLLALVTNLYINTPVMKTHLDPIQQTSKSIKRGLSSWLQLRKIMINKDKHFHYSDST